jgi:TRAP-type uncharacterized transport system substrate-binding protein
MTGSIYFPALTTIANDLNVSNSQINITVTTYLASTSWPLSRNLTDSVL